MSVTHLGRAVQGWLQTGPAHYFTAPTFQRFDPEGHAGVTHSLDKMRAVILPEIPQHPLVIAKERLEGVSHARACHSAPGQSQQVTLNCLWIMHGNSKPSLRDPDVAQVDRIAPVYLQLQYGDLMDENHVWSVPPEQRRQEDPSLKMRSDSGGFAAELFTHCKYARATMQHGLRNIKPRPAVVENAVLALLDGAATGVPDLRQACGRFCAQFLTPREVWVESSTEVFYAMKNYLGAQGVQYQGRSLGNYMEGYITRDGPRATPSSLLVWGLGSNTTRGTSPCIKRQSPDGSFIRYGLTAEGRRLCHEQMVKERADRVAPADPLSADELAYMTENFLAPIPERFPVRSTAAQTRAAANRGPGKKRA